MRSYNLFPLLAGQFNKWEPHLARASEMGFDWIFINPVQEPGLSGSLYSIKDYFAYNPIFIDKDSDASPEDQMRNVIKKAESLGLSVMIDLVANHTSIDSPLIKAHPEWFKKDKSGRVAHPWCMDGGRKVVWGDLASLDHKNSPDSEGLYQYIRGVVKHLRGLGVKGFRCDAAYQLPTKFWSRLISETKNEHEDIIFTAETLGCSHEQTLKTAKAGFDYIFNSSKWWDYKSPWLLEQYNETRLVCPSISFPESHDTLRLFEELNGNINALKQKYLFSACFSSAVMMPLGFEFGFRKRPHVVRTRPSDWEETGIDLRNFIKSVNALKSSAPILNIDAKTVAVASGNPDVLLLLKSSESSSERLLLVMNKDMENSIAFNEISVRVIFGTAGQVRNITPEGMNEPEVLRDSSDALDITLPPAGYLILHTA
jgi:starch synthase (maltosyl-transferring)